MRRAYKRALTLLIVCLILLFGTVGCGRRQVRYFGYLDSPATAVLSGHIDGVAFRATLRTGERQGTASDFTLSYLVPAALSGITIHYLAEDGRYSVTLGDLSAEGEMYAALGEIGTLLTVEQAVQTTSVDKDGRVRFETEDGAVRLHAPDGTPRRLTFARDGRAIEITVESWEQIP